CGDHLEKLFTAKGIKVIPHATIDPYNPVQVNEIIKAITEKKAHNIILNITGGTKLMALGAYEVFKEKKLPVIYCHTDDKIILHLLPEPKEEQLKVNLTIEDYLASYGFTILNEVKDDIYAEFFDLLQKHSKLKEFMMLAEKCRKAFSQIRNTTITQDIFTYQKN